MNNNLNYKIDSMTITNSPLSNIFTLFSKKSFVVNLICSSLNFTNFPHHTDITIFIRLLDITANSCNSLVILCDGLI